MDMNVVPCWVCGKEWTRNEYTKWFYFNGTLVCLSHEGAELFKEGAYKLAETRINLLEEN